MSSNKQATAELLDNIYKNVKMGTDSITTVLPKVSDDFMKREMTAQLENYSGFAARAAALLQEYGVEAEEEAITKKLSAKFGIAVNTMIDGSPSHIAEMMIKGSEMGIENMEKQITAGKMLGCDQTAVTLAEDIIAFEKECTQKMKPYLE